MIGMGRDDAADRPDQAPQVRPARPRSCACPSWTRPRPRRASNYLANAAWVQRRHHRHHRRRPDPDRARLQGLRRHDDGRRTARFRTDAPILNFFSVQSARYAEKHETYKGIDIGVYYDPQHPWNVQRMIDAAKAGLDDYQPTSAPTSSARSASSSSPPTPGSPRASPTPCPGPRAWASSPTCATRPRSTCHLCRRPRARPPVVGPPGDRRRDAGRDGAVRDPGPVLAAAW